MGFSEETDSKNWKMMSIYVMLVKLAQVSWRHECKGRLKIFLVTEIKFVEANTVSSHVSAVLQGRIREESSLRLEGMENGN